MQDQTSRRDFLKKTCGALGAGLLIAACDTTSETTTGVTKNGNTISLDLTQFSALTATNGMLLLSAEKIIIIHTTSGYSAFSSVCPHESETVRQFNGTTMTCPSHGWTYKTDGTNTVSGRKGLTKYATAVSGNTLTITT